jgi:hypothetical protein
MADVTSAVAYGTAAQGQAVFGASPTTAVWAYSPWDSTTVTPAAAAGAGTSPPTPAAAANATLTRGTLTWGTGTSTAAGSQVTVAFSATLPAVPTVLLTPTTAAAGTVIPTVLSASTTGFTVGCAVAPTASQAATVFGVAWYMSL